MVLRLLLSGTIALSLMVLPAPGAELKVDESPASEMEWGWRPAVGSQSMRTPPPFCWRPQQDAVSYALQVGRDQSMQQIEYEVSDLTFNVHTPPVTFPVGQDYFWRMRYRDAAGRTSAWSSVRAFHISSDAVEFPLPALEQLKARISADHPRLFIRPEQLPQLRELAKGRLARQYQEMVRHCRKLLENPPDISEPPLYPEGMEKLSPEWRKIWYGNRHRVIDVLDAAALLGFAYQLDGNEQFGQLACDLLMAAMEWDPLGSTDYIYNDEAGMPFAYFASRAYTFTHDLLSEQQREKCRQVMTIRGRRIYEKLCPDHLWQPYDSHHNRAWHYLGELSLAFMGEIPEADPWLWFVMNVQANVYPVWCDDDGGWHEGPGYWTSYITRYSWWADAMRSALDIDAYKVLPYFTQVGYYPMYLLPPPNTVNGGIGDQMEPVGSRQTQAVMSIFAGRTQNPYWRWYADAVGGVSFGADYHYLTFIRMATYPPLPEPREPSDLPTSRAFHGVGMAALNSDLVNSDDNVQVVFKSSPFGTRSHGMESQNTFVLQVAGEPVLIRSGKRDLYGTPFHEFWLRHTKAVNSITINQQSQYRGSALAVGRLSDFDTSPRIDFVQGEAGQAYPDHLLDRFTRSIVFIKPDLVVIYDRLAAPKPVTYEWRLHAPAPMQINGQHDVSVVNQKGACRVAFEYPRDLALTYTDKFDPEPDYELLGEHLVHYHLTAAIDQPQDSACFVTVLRPYQVGQDAPSPARFEELDDGFVISAATGDGDTATVILRKMGVRHAITAQAVRTDSDITAVIHDAAGNVAARSEYGSNN